MPKSCLPMSVSRLWYTNRQRHPLPWQQSFSACFLVEYLGSRLIRRRQKETFSDVDNEQQFSESLKASTPTRELSNTTPNTTLAALRHNHGANIGPDNHFNVAVMEAGIVFHCIRKSFPSHWHRTCCALIHRSVRPSALVCCIVSTVMIPRLSSL